MTASLEAGPAATGHCPDFLSHYYEATHGPFRNLSDLDLEEAEQTLQHIRSQACTFAARRAPDYLQVRRGLEDRVRSLFIAKGGQPVRARPQYMILGACPWLLGWYQQGCELRIPLSAFSPKIVSFTYGDTFPAMRHPDGKPYRGQVYILEELEGIITRFGLPQDWNSAGSQGPDRYIEAQVWDDAPLMPYVKSSDRQGTADPIHQSL
jgi:hypothetical protein